MSSEIIPYNARHTAPRQIAESFIIPRNFFQIARNENTLLVGPRGSGKTTIGKLCNSLKFIRYFAKFFHH